MATIVWDAVIIYNDGHQQRINIWAGSYAEAYSKAQATASCTGPAHRGVAQIIVSQR